MTAKTKRAPVAFFGGPLCGSTDKTVELGPNDALPPVVFDRYHNAGAIRGGIAYYRWEPFLTGVPRPKRTQQCCEFPGRGCPTWGPQ